MSLVLRKNPNWLETLCSTDASGEALTLLGKDGCQVQVPAALLVAVSPLVKSMMADLLPPAHSPHVISIPAVTGAVLLLVAELLSKGTAVVNAHNGEVQEVFKMMGIEAFLSYCVPNMEVKDEDLTEDCSQSEIHVKVEKSDEIKDSEYDGDFGYLSAIKIENEESESNLFLERNKSSSDILLPSKENKDKESEKPFACDLCSYTAVHKGNLNQHMLIHTGEKPFACDHCDYTTARKTHLRQHMLVHSREKPFACDQCDYRTAHSWHLKQHMLIHTGEKVFACDQCSYRAVRRSDLKKHLLIHTGEKPFACDECAHRTVSKARLKKHMLVHSTEKPFACDQCDYKSVRVEDLKWHMLIHTGVKPFACDQCDYKSVRGGHLKRHMLIHTGVKPFACDQC